MIDKLLSRLDKVRRIGEGRYTACCPAHDDKTPSLTITQAEDRILFHCHAGCYPDEILAVTGLNWCDLYADEFRAAKAAATAAYRPKPVDPLEVDINVLLIVKNKLEAGETLSAEDETRALVAYENVLEAQNVRAAS
jgi:hypothetical protein